MFGSLKIKDIALEVKDMDMAKGHVQMYVSAFGNKDAHGDIMVKGAYKKTISENQSRIKHLWQHNVHEVIGKPIEMVEDSKGLLVTSFISDVKNGDYRKLYEDGIISEHSVGFKPIKETYEKEDGANYIKEVKLFEYSSVTWGANANTPVVDIKTLSKEEKENLFSRALTIAKACQKGNYTDDTFHLLEMELNRIQSLIFKQEPSNDTLEDNEPITINLLDTFNNALKNE